jgi:outer membrane receptor protein involved in Fe transport
MSAYIADDFNIRNKLRLNLGANYSALAVNDAFYTAFQPRISARYLLPGNWSLKASYSEMAQFIHLLTNGGIGLPTDLWVPATDRIRPQRAWQTALGIAKNLGNFEISLESYYKDMSGLIEYKDGANYLNLNDDWQDKVDLGRGTSYGVEFLVQKKTGKLSGWIGYTWSKTDRLFDQLNFGRRFPYKYDRRHDVSVVAVYKWRPEWLFSMTWVYGTGNAVTLPMTRYQYFDPLSPENNIQDVDYFPARNNYRMAVYHRGDISITWKKEKKRGTRAWSFGAYNLYNRRNPFYLDIAQDHRSNGERAFIQYSLFPLIPFVKYDFTF